MPATRILTYAETLDGGGVERAMLRLAAGWIADGRRVTLLVGDASGPLAEELAAGLEVIALRRRGYWPLARALPPTIRRLEPAILFCAGNHYTSHAAIARLVLGRRCPPIVAKFSNAVVRGDYTALVALGHAAWLRATPAFVDRLVALSPASAAAAIAATRMRQDRVKVIPNPPAVRGPGAPLATGRFIVGVGRLEPQKRWDRLIDALPRLADPTVRLVILGAGRARPALARQAAALGVADRVTLAGHVADPLPTVAAATVLALVSDYEGVPSVLHEALAQGTPVVATDCAPSIAEIVRAPELGQIVPRDDPTALVAALDRRLAPGAARPTPVAPPGVDAAARYLALFDALTPA